MTRRKIELEKGSIAPITRGLWFAAVEKLHEAEIGVQEMRNAKDRIQFEAGWTRYVDSLEECWTRFYDEGKEKFSDFQPWVGAIVAERKTDALLQYVYQARHQSQHGRIALDWEEGKLKIATGFSGHIRGLKIFGNGTFEMDATPAHPTVPEANVLHDPGAPKLPIVHNKKFGQTYTPPTEHLNVKLADGGPVAVADCGLKYYADVIQRGLQKFEPRR